MANKELKRLSRRELVDVIYQLKKNEEELQERISALETELQDKRLHLSEAGTIAQAAVNVTGLLTVAQQTADLYLQEIAAMKADAQAECDKLLEEARREAEALREEDKKKREVLLANYREDYKKWQRLQAKLRKLKERMTEE
jgi:cell division septum initiation protein DivIVA